jgi:rhamnosyltransferase
VSICAVVAHYDVDDRLDSNSRLLLAVLEQVCERVVLVSTSSLQGADIPIGRAITTILRPNIGYDFYSYRVGLDEIERNGGASQVFLVNCSFHILNSAKFLGALKEMSRQNPSWAVGMTASRQIGLHLQSYLLRIGDNVLKSIWFKNFVAEIQPQNTKWELIVRYEIGLSQLLQTNGIPIVPIYRPSLPTTVRGTLKWVRAVVQLYGIIGMLKGLPLKHLREVNWVHFGAQDIAHRYGFIKTEVVRTNPLGINLGFLEEMAQAELLDTLRQSIGRTSSNYKATGDGLTGLVARGFPICQVQSGKVGRPGVRIAVVVHLFYVELLDEICAELTNIVDPFDVFVTTPFEGSVPTILKRLIGAAQSVTVLVVENRGRDIGPFVMLYRTGVLDQYTAVLKIHTKRSKYSTNGNHWRREIYRGLLGGSKLTREITELFGNSQTGIVGIGRYYLTNHKYWGADKANVARLLIEMSAVRPGEEPPLGFFAGSMFWFKPRALATLKMIATDHLIFEAENGAQDGTLAHAVERVFCNVARQQGFIVTTPALAGVDIDSINSENNQVPVL